MSPLDTWYMVVGAFLVSMAIVGPVVERLPFTPAIAYLAAGYALSFGGLGLHKLDPVADAEMLRVLSEVAVAISLFAVGLKLRVPLTWAAWQVPLRLALPAMVLTILPLSLVGWLAFQLPFGLALALAACLAPTDPVLGGDVHVAQPGDRDRVRFGVTAEGGINDGLAMPAVLLGLGLAGRHDLGSNMLHWLAVEVLWFIAGGIAIGWLVGTAVGRCVLYVRRTRQLAAGLEEFLGFGVIGLAFGLAGVALASEFLAVFAAGLALRQVERRASIESRVEASAAIAPGTDPALATDPDLAAAHMAHTLLAFNTQAEHIAELAVVMVIGALLANVRFDPAALGLATFLFVVARPAAVAITLTGSGSRPAQTRLIAWFGIRGVGSLYYLAYALQAGLIIGPNAHTLASTVLIVVATSIIIHGVSATPLMHAYHARLRRNSMRRHGD
jgi:NhaP-type Na+/H+ or K+/H+ antiporter